MECKDCHFYENKKCLDEDEFVHEDTGEPICRYHSYALDKFSYDEEAAYLEDCDRFNRTGQH